MRPECRRWPGLRAGVFHSRKQIAWLERQDSITPTAQESLRHRHPPKKEMAASFAGNFWAICSRGIVSGKRDLRLTVTRHFPVQAPSPCAAKLYTDQQF